MQIRYYYWFNKKFNYLDFEDNPWISISLGVKDKNGKEIFTKDIVQHQQKDGNFVVEYCNNPGCCKFILKYYNNKEQYEAGGGYERDVDNWSEVEVIGNTFENINLLWERRDNEKR